MAARSRSLPTSTVSVITSRLYFSLIQWMATEVSKPPEYARTTAGIMSLLNVARSHQRCYRCCKRLFAFLPSCLYLLNLPVQLLQPQVADAAEMTPRAQSLAKLLLACYRYR